MNLSQVSRCTVFAPPRGRNEAVSGTVKLKSNSTGIFTVSVRRFPRWLMGSKESRRLNENGNNQGKCRSVLSCVAM